LAGEIACPTWLCKLVENCLERAVPWWGRRFRLPGAVALFQFGKFLECSDTA
jgi:hypothetical protein